MLTSLISIIVYFIVLLILFYSQSPPFLMLRGPDKDGNIPVGNERFDGRLYFSLDAKKNLPSGVSKKRDSNQSTQLQRLARKL